MNRICFTANADTNYVFHMLSVAGCGYDNAYGAKYRDLYSREDLNILKANENLLTVRGGQHCGALYHLMVCCPARGKGRAKDYFRDLPRRTREDGEYAAYEREIGAVSAVMEKYYDHFIQNIWPQEKLKIQEYICELQRFFEESRFTERAEAMVGCPLQSDCFTAMLVTSVENGAEAIDISAEQDVFGIERSITDSVYFIGHEFIIYLLFGALKGENAFQKMETWAVTEGLAEYYLRKIMGDTRFFDGQQIYADFFEACQPGLLAAELYRLALKKEF